MKRFYNFSIEIISRFTTAVKRSNPKLEKLVDGRKNLFENLESFRQNANQSIAWFHVASLGEYEQAKPVIGAFKEKSPDYNIVVSFFSPSGFDFAVNNPQEHVDYITYLPFDTAGNAQRFIDVLKPAIGFFVKYDLWANHILEAKKNGVPLFLFSASLRGDQIYFRSYGGFFKKILKSFDHIFVQNQQTVELLKNIGFTQVSLSGDTRYDRVKQISENPKQFPEIAAFAAGKEVLVVGSAWKEDMDLIIPFINQNPSFRYIVAPHDINEHQMEDWIMEIKKPSLKYSQLSGQKEVEVLFIDNIGMLSSLYQFAKVAYVGGAFGRGLHNILEPLAYGIPVVFGKLRKNAKFPEANISIQYGCGFSASNPKAFSAIMAKLENPEIHQLACMAANKLVNDNIGSANQIIDSILKQIKPE